MLWPVGWGSQPLLSSMVTVLMGDISRVACSSGRVAGTTWGEHGQEARCFVHAWAPSGLMSISDFHGSASSIGEGEKQEFLRASDEKRPTTEGGSSQTLGESSVTRSSCPANYKLYFGFLFMFMNQLIHLGFRRWLQLENNTTQRSFSYIMWVSRY